MPAATFGDLASAAGRDIGMAVALAEGNLRGQSRAAAAAHARHLALILSGYLADIAPYDPVEAAASEQLAGWVPPVVDAREALRMAAASLRPAANLHARHDLDTGPLAAHLAGAAASLTAGHDLLRTHAASLRPAAGGAPAGRPSSPPAR